MYEGSVTKCDSELQKTQSHKDRGTFRSTDAGPGIGGQAGCYGERNGMGLIRLTGGLEKYPCPSGPWSYPSLSKGSFHDRII